MAHSLQSVFAVIVAVRWQLYRIANSPSTLAPVSVDKYLPSRDTSTRPSGIYNKNKMDQCDRNRNNNNNDTEQWK